MDVLEKALVKQELKNKGGCPPGQHKHEGIEGCHPMGQEHRSLAQRKSRKAALKVQRRVKPKDYEDSRGMDDFSSEETPSKVMGRKLSPESAKKLKDRSDWKEVDWSRVWGKGVVKPK